MCVCVCVQYTLFLPEPSFYPLFSFCHFYSIFISPSSSHCQAVSILFGIQTRKMRLVWWKYNLSAASCYRVRNVVTRHCTIPLVFFFFEKPNQKVNCLEHIISPQTHNTHTPIPSNVHTYLTHFLLLCSSRTEQRTSYFRGVVLDFVVVLFSDLTLFFSLQISWNESCFCCLLLLPF